MKHINIPIFVPHEGCPQMCTFCNQRTITGIKEEMSPNRAKQIIETVLQTVGSDCEAEIAFFGGSFTAIEQSKMIALLEAAQPYIRSGRVSSIRISTRPDAISHEILDILSKYHVKTIELGIQSMSERVLTACKRGHTAQDSIRACQMIVARNFVLGGQMMIGLPESTEQDEIQTAHAIAELGASEARIYPTVVFRDTALSTQMQEGNYIPLTLDSAIVRSCNAMEILERASVKLLRVGLCENEGMHGDSIVGGASHPALGELCRSEYYLRRFTESLGQSPQLWGNPLKITVARGRCSSAIGQHRHNAEAIKQKFSLPSLTFTENQRLSGYAFEMTAESEQLCD